MTTIRYTLFSIPLGEINPKGKEYTCNFGILATNTTTGKFVFAANGWTPSRWAEKCKADRMFPCNSENDGMFEGHVVVERDLEEVPEGLWWHEYLNERKDLKAHLSCEHAS